jgi:hypothetical protein
MMGRRRGRGVLACALGLAALAVAGCGTEEHANDPRPQPSTRVSVTLGEDAISVQPRRIAIGPEPSQQIPQNVNADQPPIDDGRPLDVVLVAANLTGTESRLEIRGPRGEVTSEPLVARGALTFQARLPTGIYSVRAAGVPDAEPGRLVVGPYRTSSENDILLP